MDLDHSDVQNRVRLMAREVASLDPIGADQIGLLLTFVGALYGLRRAAELRFDNDRTKDVDAMKREGLRVTHQLCEPSMTVDELWLAGYHFNDAILRLEALAVRMQKLHPDKKNYFDDPAPNYMRTLKRADTQIRWVPHAQVGGNAKWSITIELVAQAAQYLCGELKALLELLEGRRKQMP